MRLYFIRHGQSANNALWDETGSSSGRSVDPELTEMGHAQAQLLADFIYAVDQKAREDGKNGEPRRDMFGFTHLYTSLMVRAVATGAHLAERLGLPLVGWPEFHECGGIYVDGDTEGEHIGLPGRPRSYFVSHYRGLVLPNTVTEAGWWNRPFEVYEERMQRAEQVLATLLERHGDSEDRVAIVSHGAFYMELVRALFKLGEENCWFTMFNTAVSRFDFHPGGDVSMIYHNRTDHLPERMIT